MDQTSDLETMTEWVFRTVLMFGAKLSTAHKVAGEFAAGIERNREKAACQPTPT
jgi:hypothetical protein